MKLIVCLDNRDGMLFNRRRQSRDQAVCADVLELADDGKLWMNGYSGGMFPAEHIVIDEAFLEKAEAQDYCFLENADISAYASKVNRVIVYRWNREYPADTYFPMGLFCDRWKQTESKDMVGKSHECITREVYVL